MQMVFAILLNAVPVSGTKHYWRAELESCKNLKWSHPGGHSMGRGGGRVVSLYS